MLKHIPSFNSDIYKRIFDKTSDGILITDASETILAVNKAFCHITGYTQDEVLGNTPRILKSKKQDSSFYKNMWQSLQNKDHWEGAIWNRKKSGELYAEWLSINSLKNNTGELEYYVAIFSDITKVKQVEKKLQALAYQDTLTQLSNRLAFSTHLDKAIKLAKREKQRISLFFIDLNNFKSINDTYGHHVGDQVLSNFGKRLQGAFRQSDIIARLGGDEFALIIPIKEESLEKLADKIAKKVHNIFREKLLRDEKIKIDLSASIGVSVFPDDTESPEKLIQFADEAMYKAKKMPEKNYHFYKEISKKAENTYLKQ